MQLLKYFFLNNALCSIILLQNNNFNNGIINSTNNLKAWNVQNVMIAASYDFNLKSRSSRVRGKDERIEGHCYDRTDCVQHCEHDCDDNSRIIPQIRFFYKLAVDGKSVIDNDTVGGELAVSF